MTNKVEYVATCGSCGEELENGREVAKHYFMEHSTAGKILKWWRKK